MINKNFNNFDKQFERTKKTILYGSIISIILGLGSLGFIFWIIVKIMIHFGII